jgi:hypothetical protein
MTDRYSKKDAEQCASYLAKALKRQFGNCYKRTRSGSKAKVGCWELDCNSTYGGCVINQIANESGGVTQPFGARRLKPEYFCIATHFAEKALEYKKRRK